MPLQVSCPICKKIVAYEGNPHRPFCSERCRSTDLGAWASGEYAIPGKSSELAEDSVSSSELDSEDSESPRNLH